VDHISLTQIEDYRQQRLSATALIECDDHLATCATCRQRLVRALPASVLSLIGAWQAESPASHMSFEQFVAWAEDKAAGEVRQFCIDHLASCAMCRQAADDLAEFVNAEAAPPEVLTDKPSWWERWWPAAPLPAFGWAMAALVLLLLAGALLRYLVSERKPDSQIVLVPSPTPLVPLASPSPPQLLAQLKDGGGLVTLDSQGKLTGLEALSAAHQQLVKEALKTERLTRPDALAGLNRAGSSLMGSDEQGVSFALRAPANQVVLATRPTFQWTPLKDATSYVVEIYDERFNLVAQSAAVTTTRWTPAKPLARGQLFAWQVKAKQDNQTVIAPKPPAPQARFRIVTNEQAETIALARRANGTAHLPLALLYLQAGLLDEAEVELVALRQANPQAETVRRWLSQLKAMRR
jgi:hypothetical protein